MLTSDNHAFEADGDNSMEGMRTKTGIAGTSGDLEGYGDDNPLEEPGTILSDDECIGEMQSSDNHELEADGDNSMEGMRTTTCIAGTSGDLEGHWDDNPVEESGGSLSYG